MQHLNIHAIMEYSTENGPGLRTVIWVQGCTLKCPGCFNPDTHDMGIRQRMSVEELTARIEGITDIEGVTISGGEPFLQAAPLAEFCRRVHHKNLGVIVFSGFTFEHLTRAGDPGWSALLAETDVLIAGPFVQELACRCALRGSSNQTLHILSGRYTSFQNELVRENNTVEVLIDEEGRITVTGFPEGDLL